ncbi:formate--tetrahydrofolate ligase 1 [Nitrospira sp.]|nr:formate--tetrahydrofolate ligase 1 [Nitrospira sp.]
MSDQHKSMHEVAGFLGLDQQDWIPYGLGRAKLRLDVLEHVRPRPSARYVLVTAINPTPLGEGKTTTSIGLAMGLCRLGHRAVPTLRQPSIGPVFGIKGGGAGGGRAQLFPMSDVNLHLTGDAHAVAAAHNLLAAFVDNHIFHGNDLGIVADSITWPRAMAVSDRALRHVQIAMDRAPLGRSGEFVITEASEVMAILALAKDGNDLQRRLERIMIGLGGDRKPVSAADLRCAGAMAALLQEALMPNLVQTSEGTPALVHAGPFGNIAHGNCSILADAMALRYADYVVTEAGFGSDLGAEKFFNIKCRVSGLVPRVAVLVVTLRALKLHGGGGTVKSGHPLPAGLVGPNPEALERGMENMQQHLANVRAHGIPVVAAINAFRDDPPDELEWVRTKALAGGACAAAVATHFMDGGRGAETLAKVVVEACEQPSSFTALYRDTDSIKQKIELIATRIYGAEAVRYEAEAERQIETATALGFGSLPICMAKTPLSLSHDASLLGRPRGFTVPIKELRILAGAGFLTAVCSGMQLMPGLPKRPAGERIGVDPQTGEIHGLF